MCAAKHPQKFSVARPNVSPNKSHTLYYGYIAEKFWQTHIFNGIKARSYVVVVVAVVVAVCFLSGAPNQMNECER